MDPFILIPFLKINFSFATLQAFGEISCEIETLQIAEIGVATRKYIYILQQL